MLVSKAAMEADRTVAIYSLPRLLAELRETYDDDARYSLNELLDRLARSTCCTSTTSAPSRARPWVLEQLYTIVNTRYEDGSADAPHHEPRPTTSCATQIGAAHGVAPVRDVRRRRCRCSATRASTGLPGSFERRPEPAARRTTMRSGRAAAPSRYGRQGRA